MRLASTGQTLFIECVSWLLFFSRLISDLHVRRTGLSAACCVKPKWSVELGQNTLPFPPSIGRICAVWLLGLSGQGQLSPSSLLPLCVGSSSHVNKRTSWIDPRDNHTRTRQHYGRAMIHIAPQTFALCLREGFCSPLLNKREWRWQNHPFSSLLPRSLRALSFSFSFSRVCVCVCVCVARSLARSLARSPPSP